jgi:hypothetical protein
MMNVEQSVELELAREAEENLPHCQFVHSKSHMTRSWLEPGPPLWESGE